MRVTIERAADYVAKSQIRNHRRAGWSRLHRSRGAQTELVGTQEDGVLKIRLVSSPAGDPSTNQELITFLSEQLGVPVNKIEIVAGANGREKIISVEGISTADVEAKLGGRKADD
jgi:uncharacterized protein YggU (UPF0235/DUF167 family)